MKTAGVPRELCHPSIGPLTVKKRICPASVLLPASMCPMKTMFRWSLHAHRSQLIMPVHVGECPCAHVSHHIMPAHAHVNACPCAMSTIVSCMAMPRGGTGSLSPDQLPPIHPTVAFSSLPGVLCYESLICLHDCVLIHCRLVDDDHLFRGGRSHLELLHATGKRCESNDDEAQSPSKFERLINCNGAHLLLAPLSSQLARQHPSQMLLTAVQQQQALGLAQSVQGEVQVVAEQRLLLAPDLLPGAALKLVEEAVVGRMQLPLG